MYRIIEPLLEIVLLKMLLAYLCQTLFFVYINIEYYNNKDLQITIMLKNSITLKGYENMNELVMKNTNLPYKLEDLSRFVLPRNKKINSVIA